MHFHADKVDPAWLLFTEIIGAIPLQSVASGILGSAEHVFYQLTTLVINADLGKSITLQSIDNGYIRTKGIWVSEVYTAN